MSSRRRTADQENCESSSIETSPADYQDYLSCSLAKHHLFTCSAAPSRGALSVDQVRGKKDTVGKFLVYIGVTGSTWWPG